MCVSSCLCTCHRMRKLEMKILCSQSLSQSFCLSLPSPQFAFLGLSLSVCLFVLSLSQSVCPSLPQSVRLSLSISVRLCRSVRPSLSVSVCPSQSVSLSLSVEACQSQSVCLSLPVFACLLLFFTNLSCSGIPDEGETLAQTWSAAAHHRQRWNQPCTNTCLLVAESVRFGIASALAMLFVLALYKQKASNSACYPQL